MSSDMSFSPLTYLSCENLLIIHVFALLVFQINSFNNVEESLWGPNDFKGAKESTFHVIDWEFVMSLSRKNGNSWLLCHEKLEFRDFYITKYWDVVTYLSRKMGISWPSCHETLGFRDVVVTKKNSSSHETVRFHDISVLLLS